MIKFVLVIYAVTAQGTIYEPIAEFTKTNRQYCEDVGVLVVNNLAQQPNIKAATYRCVEVTKV